MSRVADALSELATQKVEELRHERDTARQEAADLRAALSELEEVAVAAAEIAINEMRGSGDNDLRTVRRRVAAAIRAAIAETA